MLSRLLSILVPGLLLALGLLAYWISTNETAKEILRSLGRIVAAKVFRSHAVAVTTIAVFVVALLVVTNRMHHGHHRALTPIAVKTETASAPGVSPERPQSAPVTPSAQPVTTGPASISPTPTAPKASHATSLPIAVLTEADQFVRAWVAHTGKGLVTWHQRVDQYATPSLRAGLDQTDPRNVPAGKVTGAPVAGPTADGRAMVTVPTNTWPIQVTLLHGHHGWRVDSVDVTYE